MEIAIISTFIHKPMCPMFAQLHTHISNKNTFRRHDIKQKDLSFKILYTAKHFKMNYHQLTFQSPSIICEVPGTAFGGGRIAKATKELTWRFLPMDNFSKEYPITFYPKHMHFLAGPK